MDNDGATGGKCGRDFPGSHEEREIPRNNLPDDANRFAQDDGKVFFVQLVGRAFFATNDASEIAEMVGGKRDIGSACFADRFAVIQRFLQRE